MSHYDPLKGRPLSVYIRYAVPSVTGLVVFSSAQIIDAIFLGQFVGTHALAAVNLALPAIAFCWALPVMCAVGSSAVAGTLIGKNNISAAGDLCIKTLFVNGALAIILVIIVNAFQPWIVIALGTPPDLYELVGDYLRFYLYCFPAIAVSICLYYYAILDNRPILSATAIGVSALINIALDAVLIVGLDMGTAGAAIATGIALSTLGVIIVVARYWQQRRIPFRIIHWKWRTVIQAAYNGVSELINESSVGITTLIFNWVLVTRIGTMGVAAYAIVEYLAMVALMVYFGCSEAMQPLVSKNMGANQPQRVRQFLSINLLTTLAIGMLALTSVLLFPETLSAIFLAESDRHITQFVHDYLLWYAPALLLSGINICISLFFTAILLPRESILVASLRSLILPGLFVLILPMWFAEIGIFVAIPIAEACTLVVVAFLLIYLLQRTSSSLYALRHTS